MHDHLRAVQNSEVMRTLDSNAGRVISLVHIGDLPQYAPPWPVIWQMTREDFVGRGITVAKFAFIQEPFEERQVRDDVLALLREEAALMGAQWRSLSRSWPTLHRKLLALASASDEDPESAERAWVLLDRMEGIATDSWLIATKVEVDRAFEQGRSCVVMAETVTEAHYIADYLDVAGLLGGGVVSGRTRITERRDKLAHLLPAECVVSTFVAVDAVDLFPAATTVVLWPAFSSRGLIDQLSWRRPGRDVTVVELRVAGRVDVLPALTDPPQGEG